jgi:CRP-like cAMP-binding protein
MKSLITLLHYHFSSTPELLDDISTAFTKTTYPKGSILLHPGDVSDKICFIEAGILREYFIDADSGEEYTTQLVTENTFFYSTESYIFSLPSNRSVEVVESCRLVSIKKGDVESFCEKSHRIEHFIRAMLEQTLVQAERRAQVLRFKRSEERLHAFEQLHPELGSRIPQKHLASFLNITPQNLSKVRRERMTK